MTRRLRGPLRGSTYSGALLAFGAAPASLLLLPVAAVPALLWRAGPYGARLAVVLLLWTALVGSVGLFRTTRRMLVAGARRLLRVPLPTPVAGVVAQRRPGRWRTPLWLVLQVALGWAGAMLSLMLLVLGVALPGNWLHAEGGLSLFGRSVRLAGGAGSWLAAACCLLLVPWVCAAVTTVLRWAAPRLLGPSPAERLAAAAEREHALAERNRLAHELHDSIGHTLTATTIQAAVAGEMVTADPTAARAALHGIEESSRAALEDLDYVLGVLREEKPPTAPARTLSDLPELLDRVRCAGVVVDLDVSGELGQVHRTLSREAYRIVQEGLTNALRYGSGDPIEVRVAVEADGIDLDVTNGLRAGAVRAPRAYPTSGHGLPGLTERVRLLHGRIEVGRDGPGRWRLSVRLPARLAA